jgi:class 3 adenylate cyclase
VDGTLTFLFADLRDYTAFVESHGDAAAAALLEEYRRLVREEIGRSGGGEIKTEGDSFYVVFPSARQALQAGLGILSQADLLSARHPARPMRIGVGIHTGEPLPQEGQYVGSAVNIAARLAQQAAAGELLVSEVVRGLLRTSGMPPMVEREGVVLKGIADGPRIYAMVRADSAVPLSPPLAADERFQFVGRQAELAVLRRAWKEASAGQRHLVVVIGEPGVGKTRLITEFSRAAHAGGATVLFGRCDEDLGVPYQPFVEALAHFCANVPTPQLQTLLGHPAGELVRLLPELSERLPGLPPPVGSDPETEVYRLFEGVAGWLGAASTASPLLLLLDDLHWATRPTLLLLRHVLRSSIPARLLLIATARLSELPAGHPMVNALSDMERDSTADRLALSGLDNDGVAAFVEAADPGRWGAEMTHAIHDQTRGNSFFVGEVVRHLRESRLASKVPEGRADSLIKELGVPTGVREVVRRRISRLSPTTGAALDFAAVIGLEFDEDILLATSRVESNALTKSLEEAVAAGLIEDLGGARVRYRFAHALVRDTLYDALGSSRRALDHARAGAAIEAARSGSIADHVSELAYHFARAGAPHARAAISYSTQSGDRSLRQLAYDEAAGFYGEALRLADTYEGGQKGVRTDLMIALGEAQKHAGDPAHRKTLLGAAAIALESGDTERLARAALANNRGKVSVVGEVDGDRVRVLEAAIAAVGTTDLATRSRLLATLAIELTFAPREWERRVGLSDEAVSLARGLDDQATLAFVLALRHEAIIHPSTLRESLAVTAELADLADKMNDPNIGFHAAYYGFWAALAAGDLDLADRRLAIAQRLAEELGQPYMRWLAGVSTAARLAVAGQLEESERTAAAAAKHGIAGGHDDAPGYLSGQLYYVRLYQGRLDEVLEETEEMVRRYPGLDIFKSTLAKVYLETDRHPQAADAFELLAAKDFTDRPINEDWLSSMGINAELSFRLRDRKRAKMLLPLLAPYQDQFVANGAGWEGSVHHYLGYATAALGRLSKAEDHLAAAAEAHERLRAPYYLALSQLVWAEVLISRDRPRDRTRAAGLLREARTAAREFGFAAIERRTADRLAAAH